MKKKTGLEVAKGKKLAKYIITSACPRKCPYCLSKHMKLKEETRMFHVAQKLQELVGWGYEGVMVSGGEPTASPLFLQKTYLCKAFFPFVAITTGQEGFLHKPEAKLFDEIVLSLHCGILNTPKVPAGMKVFASILDFQYDESVPFKLAELGYAGLTISEDKYGGEEFDESRIPPSADLSYCDGLSGQYKKFNVKLNRRDYCLADRHFLLPNLSFITDYSEFLEQEDGQSNWW